MGWGEERYTGSRPIREGEAYLPIPAEDAYEQGYMNSNATGGKDVVGENIFYCTSKDGFFEREELKSQGDQNDHRYAKQFSVNNSLQRMGDYYTAIGAQPGDKIRVTRTSPTEIFIEKI